MPHGCHAALHSAPSARRSCVELFKARIRELEVAPGAGPRRFQTGELFDAFGFTP